MHKQLLYRSIYIKLCVNQSVGYKKSPIKNWQIKALTMIKKVIIKSIFVGSGCLLFAFVLYVEWYNSTRVIDFHTQCREIAIIELEGKKTPVAKCIVSRWFGLIRSKIIYEKFTYEYTKHLMKDMK